jgi:hypothetical protein
VRWRAAAHVDALGRTLKARRIKAFNQYTAACGYPQFWLVALVACGTQAIIDAVFGPATDGEPAYATQLVRSLRQGMTCCWTGAGPVRQ